VDALLDLTDLGRLIRTATDRSDEVLGAHHDAIGADPGRLVGPHLQLLVAEPEPRSTGGAAR
jgi:hypothetical protein